MWATMLVAEEMARLGICHDGLILFLQDAMTWEWLRGNIDYMDKASTTLGILQAAKTPLPANTPGMPGHAVPR